MKKLMMLFAFVTFAALANVNAQSCCAKKSASCAGHKEETSTTQVAGESMVKKVASTTEAPTCAKGEKAACCSKAGGKACAGKDARTTAVTAEEKKVVKAVSTANGTQK